MSDQHFLCGDRGNNPVASIAFPGPDHWRRMPNGDRTCSFCGSMHEDDYLAVLKAYADGEPGYDFDPSTKAYKRYARRPGVKNASQGGIKFYGWHADLTAGPALDAKRDLSGRALERWRREMATHSAPLRAR